MQAKSSPTRIPRSTDRPASFAISIFGRMPALMISKSHDSALPSLNRTPPILPPPVAERTKNKNAVQESACGAGESFDPGNEWFRTRCKDQPVIVLLDSIGRENHLSGAVDGIDANSGVKRDAVLRIPVERIQND